MPAKNVEVRLLCAINKEGRSAEITCLGHAQPEYLGILTMLNIMFIGPCIIVIDEE